VKVLVNSKGVVRVLALSLVASAAGCAVVTTLDHPAAQVRLTSNGSPVQAKEVWFSPVDFFAEGSSDAAKVCVDRQWRSSSVGPGLAEFQARTSTHVINFTNSDSTFDKMDKMNRGFAVCMERIGGGVEYLTTVRSGDVMFAAGAKLKVDCRLGTEKKWDCNATIEG
jgi:hypothetical protein